MICINFRSRCVYWTCLIFIISPIKWATVTGKTCVCMFLYRRYHLYGLIIPLPYIMLQQKQKDWKTFREVSYTSFLNILPVLSKIPTYATLSLNPNIYLQIWLLWNILPYCWVIRSVAVLFLLLWLETSSHLSIYCHCPRNRSCSSINVWFLCRTTLPTPSCW